MISGERWLTLGAAVLGLGATVATSYWIYVLQSGPGATFWELPGYIGLAIVGTGLLLSLVGLFGRSDSQATRQVQRAGRRSTNYQAGRDLTVNRDVGKE